MQDCVDAVSNHPIHRRNAHGVAESEADILLGTRELKWMCARFKAHALKACCLDTKEPPYAKLPMFSLNHVLRGRAALGCPEATGKAIEAQIEDLFPLAATPKAADRRERGGYA